MNRNKIQRIGTLLGKNVYPGRGIIVGKSKNGRNAVFAYFIMGRSENSRNRVFIEQGDEVIIHPYDPSLVTDPTLIIYSPIKKFENKLIVTNGDQTETIYRTLSKGGTFEKALETRRHEPDAPNYTPRISAIAELNGQNYSYKLSILKSGNENGTTCQRNFFCYESENGLGHFIHTYKGDGDPLPTFEGDPERVKIPDDINAFTNDIWENLYSENKISLYVRYIDLSTGKNENRVLNKNGRRI